MSDIDYYMLQLFSTFYPLLIYFNGRFSLINRSMQILLSTIFLQLSNYPYVLIFFVLVTVSIHLVHFCYMLEVSATKL